MPTRTTPRTSARPSPSTKGTQLASIAPFSPQAPSGSMRSCQPYRDELLRHRVISADGRDVAVATYSSPRTSSLLTAAYPVQHGYMVLVRQPLYEISSATEEEAREAHMQLVRVLAEAGTRVVHARRALAARSLKERETKARETARPTVNRDSSAAALPYALTATSTAELSEGARL